MDKNYTNIKERVIFYAKANGSSIEKFLKSIGMTYGSFKGKAKTGALNSDAIAKIYTMHPDISLEWLLIGEGQMIKENKKESLNSDSTTFKEDLNSNELELLKKDLETTRNTLEDKIQMIHVQKDLVNSLKAEIQRLNIELELLKKQEKPA